MIGSVQACVQPLSAQISSLDDVFEEHSALQDAHGIPYVFETQGAGYISSLKTMDAGVLALMSVHLSLCTYVAFTM